jgi:hypothetical protein
MALQSANNEGNFESPFLCPFEEFLRLDIFEAK